MPIISGIYAANANKEASKYATDKNIEMNRENNLFNAEQAQIQRDYETEMSNTAIQRRIDDLKAAGLNPMLAVEGGGASTPTSAAASSSGFAGAHSAHFDSLVGIESGLSKLATSAFAVHQIKKVVRNDPIIANAMVKAAPYFLRGATSAAGAKLGASLVKAFLI